MASLPMGVGTRIIHLGFSIPQMALISGGNYRGRSPPCTIPQNYTHRTVQREKGGMRWQHYPY
jgi:hypothetical protein